SPERPGEIAERLARLADGFELDVERADCGLSIMAVDSVRRRPAAPAPPRPLVSRGEEPLLDLRFASLGISEFLGMPAELEPSHDEARAEDRLVAHEPELLEPLERRRVPRDPRPGPEDEPLCL